MRYLLGLDDTDSRLGHCTTHLGYLIVTELSRAGCALPSYPRLVRLNPNVPFKTRGNAAICIEFESQDPEYAFGIAKDLLEKESDVKNGANAALVMVAATSDSDTAFARRLYERAIRGIVSFRGVMNEVSRTGIEHVRLGNGMGIVGALASIGFPYPSTDHTYELIAYRMPKNCGTPRQVERESVRLMDRETFPHTFNNYDHESGRVLLAPTGPDPVLVGVRGDSPKVVLDSFNKIRIGENVLGHIIYATNQCTDAHLQSQLSTPLSTYSAGWIIGVVASMEPKEGGHLLITLRLENNSSVDCWVYEPSGDLRHIANSLMPGDKLRISGGVRKASPSHARAINVERIEVHSLTRRSGRRRIRPGAYLPSPRSQRHLTKQLVRYGNEVLAEHDLIDGWIAERRSVSATAYPSGKLPRAIL